jgi:hypothetical protein
MPFPVDEQFILETERELGLTFPVTFKSRMKKENGGEIEATDDTWTIYPFFDKSDIKRVKRTTNSILLETKNARKWDNFPANAIVIGENAGGDKLILMPADATPEQLSENIFMWLHETGEVVKLADNFDELEYSL